MIIEKHCGGFLIVKNGASGAIFKRAIRSPQVSPNSASASDGTYYIPSIRSTFVLPTIRSTDIRILLNTESCLYSKLCFLQISLTIGCIF